MTSSFDMSAKALQARAKRAVDELSDQAMQRVEARLLRNDRRDQEAAGASGAPISKPTALLPAAVNQESNIMAQLQKDAERPLSFLSAPPSRPTGDDHAQLVAGEGDAARARRNDENQDQRKAAAEAKLRAELEAATKTQLQRLRQSLSSDLQSHGDDAIERLLATLTRLVVRVLSLGHVVLPPTEAERRVLVARATIGRIDAELLRRQTHAASEGQPKGRPSSPATPLSPTAQEKFLIVRPHEARQHQKSSVDRDRDAVARALDAKREGNGQS